MNYHLYIAKLHTSVKTAECSTWNIALLKGNYGRRKITAVSG